MGNKTNLITRLIMSVFLLPVAYTATADAGCSILWLKNTETIVYQPQNGGVWYPRLLGLDNGDWLCVYDTREWIDPTTRVCVSRSTDKGSTWTFLSQSSFGTGDAANGQLIQLTNGEVLCAYRVVNETTKTLKVSKSTNNGQSWNHLSTIISNTEGVWEPHIIQKADGQLLVFYAQEGGVGGDDQIIEMQRSDDNGSTWHSPQIVCQQVGSRDGMPVPSILNNGDILVVLEGHNVLRNYQFVIWSVSSSDGGNTWGPRKLVYAPTNIDRYAAAPFVVQVPTGDIVASFQTNEVPTSYGEEMGIVMSWDNGSTWFSQPRPFSGEYGSNYYWNSLFVQDPHTIVAATTSWGIGSDKIKVIKGIIHPIGDFDHDCASGLFDFSILASAWSSGPEDNRWNPACNISIPIDNFVGLPDLVLFVENWLTGIPPFQVSNPHPTDGMPAVIPTDDLIWTAGLGATSYDVYFGTNSPVTFQYNQTKTTFDPGTMVHDSTYYWRIDAVNSWGKTTGKVWSFTTIYSDLQAMNPNPSNGAFNVSTTADMSWTAGADATLHDVYFGTSNPPPFLLNQDTTVFDPGIMADSVTYYWRINEISAYGTTIGKVWSFTTLISPPPPPP